MPRERGPFDGPEPEQRALIRDMMSDSVVQALTNPYAGQSVQNFGPAGYEPSGGPQRPNPLGMLPAWLIELILGGGYTPPAPPPPPRRGIPGINGGMLPIHRPYQDSSLPPRHFPPRG